MRFSVAADKSTKKTSNKNASSSFARHSLRLVPLVSSSSLSLFTVYLARLDKRPRETRMIQDCSLLPIATFQLNDFKLCVWGHGVLFIGVVYHKASARSHLETLVGTMYIHGQHLTRTCFEMLMSFRGEKWKTLFHRYIYIYRLKSLVTSLIDFVTIV